MKRISMAVLLLVMLNMGCATTGDPFAGADISNSRVFGVHYIAKITEIPAGALELQLWVPLPQDNGQQRISAVDLKPSVDCRVTRDERYGNRMVFFSIQDPPPELNVALSFRVHRLANEQGSGTRRYVPAVSRDISLMAGSLVPLNAEIRAMAAKIIEGKNGNVAKARALYDHVLKEMTYDKSGIGWGRGDFEHARKICKGNCTDYHAYFIGLCRNAGIPAFFEIGLSIPSEGAHGKTGGYHCWAYFWSGKDWVPVDISEADKYPEKTDYFFGNHCMNRVAFARGRDITLEPIQKSEPLQFFIYPYAEIDGKLHAKVEKVSYFKNLD